MKKTISLRKRLMYLDIIEEILKELKIDIKKINNKQLIELDRILEGFAEQIEENTYDKPFWI